MSDGMFTVPIATDDGRVLGWGRGPAPVAGAMFHRSLGTDIRFLRVVHGEVVELSQEEKDAILAKDVADAQAREAATTAEAAAAASTNAAHQARIQSLRDAYASATAQLCQLAGLDPVRCLTLEQVQQAVMPLLASEHANLVNGLSDLLTNLEVKLCLMDGTDALDRV